MENNVKFKNRYYQLLLLAKNQDSKSVFDRTSEEKEFLSYRIVLESQIFYNDRDLYISLVEEYLTEADAGSLGTDLFVYEFCQLWAESQVKFEALECEVLDQGISRLNNFSINSKSKKFYNLLEVIFTECEFKDDENMTDDLFRSAIEGILLEINECLNTYTYKDAEVLRFTMAFFSVTSIFLYSFLKLEVFSFLAI